MAGGSTTTRQIGSACRIYKNSDDKVLALDDISVTATQRRISAQNFFNSSSYNYKRFFIHLGVGDRVVAKIIMLGDYASLTEDSGNYNTATWAGTDNSNDSTMDFSTLAQLGDTL